MSILIIRSCVEIVSGHNLKSMNLLLEGACKLYMRNEAHFINQLFQNAYVVCCAMYMHVTCVAVIAAIES